MEVEVGRDGIKLDTNISKQPQCKKTIKQCLDEEETVTLMVGQIL